MLLHRPPDRVERLKLVLGHDLIAAAFLAECVLFFKNPKRDFVMMIHDPVLPDPCKLRHMSLLIW